MATEEKKTYSDDEVEAKIAEHGLDGWYLEDGWLRRKYNTDGWPSTLMARQRRRLRLRGGLPPRRPLGDVGQAVGEAHATTPPAASPTRTSRVARQIEDTVLWRPADDSPLEGTPNKFVFSKGSKHSPQACPSGCSS